MIKTLLKIQELLDDIRSDVELLNLARSSLIYDPLPSKVERVRQLLEGVVREMESKDAK